MTSKKTIELHAMELLELSFDQPADGRKKWLEEVIGDDTVLHDLVFRLIEQDQDTDSVIATGQAFRIVGADMPADIPERIGGYSITRLIGQGGMGAVYEGVRDQGDFDLRVAIKVIKSGLLSEALIERFLLERQTLARLNHPGIARLFDGGQLKDGSPYFIMEYVDGVPITEYAQANALDEKEKLSLFEQICEAVRYAHKNLIVHRDITPSNVLVTKEGKIKLIDFGISKPPSEDNHNVGSDKPSLISLSFTPGFAAPERMTGTPATILTDVYSLGRLLEALLADLTLPRDLQNLIHAAVEQNPERRLSSVDSLQSDIQNYLSDRPLFVSSRRFLYVTLKFLKRNTLPSLLMAALAVSVVGGLIYTTFLYQQTDKARLNATQRFNETRELVDFLIGDVVAELKNVPGTLQLRETIGKKSEIYLEILRKASKSDSDLRYQYASNLYLMAEAGIADSSEGFAQTEKHVVQVKKAIDILREVDSEGVADNKTLARLAKALVAYAYTLPRGKRGEYLVEGLEVAERAIAMEPNSAYSHFVKLQAMSFDIAEKEFLSKFRYDSTGDFVKMAAYGLDILDRFPDHKNAENLYVGSIHNGLGVYLDEWTSFSAPVPKADEKKFQDIMQALREALVRAKELTTRNGARTADIIGYVSTKELEMRLLLLEREDGPKTPKERKEYGQKLLTDIREVDALLEKMGLLAGDNYTYLERVWYQSEMKMIIYENFLEDFENALTENKKLIDLDQKFLEDDPTESPLISIASTLTSKAQLMHKVNKRNVVYSIKEICTPLELASKTWNNPRDSWSDYIDYYADDKARTENLITEIGCL